MLLKNEKSILPIKPGTYKKIAVIGPNAARSISSGGGSSALLAHYATTPLDSFRSLLAQSDPSVQILHAPGPHINRYIPLVNPVVMTDPLTKESGFAMQFWTNTEHMGEPILTEHRPSSVLICYDGLPPALTTGARYSYRSRTILKPKTSGGHWLSLSTCGPAKLSLDGQILLDIDRSWDSPKSSLFMSYGSPEQRVQVQMEAGKEYELQLDSISREPAPIELTYFGQLDREEIMDGARVGFMEEEKRDLLQEAIEVASECDLVLLVVGRDNDWETETTDMVDMNLPGDSDLLVSKVLEANSNTVVVNQTGGPIAMSWEPQASTIVQVPMLSYISLFFRFRLYTIYLLT